MTTTPFLGETDLFLFAQGTHERIYEKLGAQLIELDGIRGTHFAVWAPNAKEVNLIGDFNGWSGDQHPLTPAEQSGLWSCFVPGLEAGNRYKYRVTTQAGADAGKGGPSGFCCRVAPQLPPRLWRILMPMPGRTKLGCKHAI